MLSYLSTGLHILIAVFIVVVVIVTIMSQRFKLRSLLRRTMNRVAVPRDKVAPPPAGVCVPGTAPQPPGVISSALEGNADPRDKLAPPAGRRGNDHQLLMLQAASAGESVSLEQLATSGSSGHAAGSSSNPASAGGANSHSLPHLHMEHAYHMQQWQERGEEAAAELAELERRIDSGRRELHRLQTEIKQHRRQSVGPLAAPADTVPSAAVVDSSRHLQQLVEQLRAENQLLRRGAASAAAISDTEKQHMLAGGLVPPSPPVPPPPPPPPRDGGVRAARSAPSFVTQERCDTHMAKCRSQQIWLGSGADARVAASVDGGGAEFSGPAANNDWDKRSSSSMSEYSVADLQDRITQMEETHHSTNEELQATLQELQDLQNQLMQTRHDNQQLTQQKQLLMESVLELTTRLDTADQRLRQLHVQHQTDTAAGQDTEYKLRQMVQSVEQERDMLSGQLHEADHQLQLLSARHAEQLLAVQQQSGAGAVPASAAAADTEQLHQKQLLESRQQLADVQKQLKLVEQQLKSSCEETERLNAEITVVKNAAQKDLACAEYRHEQLLTEKNAVASTAEMLQTNIHELQLSCQRHLEEKRELKSSLSEHQQQLCIQRDRCDQLQNQLTSCQQLQAEEQREWQQFQRDLLLSVRVANDFRTEAQQLLAAVSAENERLRKQLLLRQQQVDGEGDEPDAARETVGGDAPTATTTAAAAVRKQQKADAQTVMKTGVGGRPAVSALTNTTAAAQRNGKLSVKTLIESLEATNGGGPSSSSVSTDIPCSSTSSSSSSSCSTSALAQHARLSATASLPVYSCAASRGGVPGSESALASSKSAGSRNLARTYTDGLFSKSSVCDAVKAMNSVSSSSTSSAIDECDGSVSTGGGRPLTSILSNKLRRGSFTDQLDGKDPLASLVKNGGSRRNALLKWCQNRTIGYRDVDITNFSSSWNDGMAFCALLHSYLPDRLAYDSLDSCDKRRNFNTAFQVAESAGITSTLNTSEMVSQERPDWQQVLAYVTSIYRHFES